ncbi:MAG TPA: dephospho-CoA kinase [Casimicrobiaceae bacterium]
MIVGLTGGIGSGKSEVARAFAALGVDVEDADAVAHALSEPGEPGHRAVVEAFGAEAMRADGSLDRDWLRGRAFSDAAFRTRLEALLHPLIRARIDAAVGAWRGPYGLLVVPLLLERGGVRERVDRVLVVDCPEDEQVRRVVARSGLTSAAVQRIMATQLSRGVRLAQADDVIDNSGTLAAMQARVAELDRAYRALAAALRPGTA